MIETREWMKKSGCEPTRETGSIVSRSRRRQREQKQQENREAAAAALYDVRDHAGAFQSVKRATYVAEKHSDGTGDDVS